MSKHILLVSVDLDYQTDTDGNDVFQFVYGSQLYGTFFGVYAKFNGRDNVTDNCYDVDSVRLLLHNYQGSVNIGFVDKPDAEAPARHEGFNIVFGVQAESRLQDFVVKCDKPMKVKRKAHPRLTFDRILYPLRGFENRNTPEGKKPTDPLPDPIPSTGVFDTEFHYRNGLIFYNRTLRPGMLGYRNVSLNDSKLFHPTAPSDRCHSSNVNLHY